MIKKYLQKDFPLERNPKEFAQAGKSLLAP